MRTVSTWQQLLATTDEHGVQLHQYASADVRADVGGSAVRLAIETSYPWDGLVTVEVLETPDRPWTLTLRRPAWASGATVAWEPERAVTADGGMPAMSDAPGAAFARTSTWRQGDRVVLDLGVTPRVTEPDTRIDAVRGCIALERGPLVYAVETVDLPAGVDVEGLAIDLSHPIVDRPRPEVSEGAVGFDRRGRPSGVRRGCLAIQTRDARGRARCRRPARRADSARGSPLLRVGESRSRRDARLDPAGPRRLRVRRRSLTGGRHLDRLRAGRSARAG